MRSEWTELALLQQQTGSTAMYAFTLAVVLVFLVLAAQYESWSLPLAVILVVPMCLLCSTVGRQHRQDGYQHIYPGRLHRAGRPGLQECDLDRRVRQVTARERRRRAGQATLEACELRLRPIMMTSLAFILGVVPLVLSQGAGAEMRQDPGHGRLQRHAGRDPVRNLPHAGLLLRHPVGE